MRLEPSRWRERDTVSHFPRVTQSRGQPIPSTLAPYVFATLHPSAVLRAPDDAARQAAMERLVDDLAAVAQVLARVPG
jgi:uracil-DNA glycosylase